MKSYPIQNYSKPTETGIIVEDHMEITESMIIQEFELQPSPSEKYKVFKISRSSTVMIQWCKGILRRPYNLNYIANRTVMLGWEL